MKRKIIEIDEALCNGCGACLPNCPEGAIQIIDGKARLVGEHCCDGLGACLGTCPLGALQVVEREAAPYDETLVMRNIIKQGVGTIKAHLLHLKDHNEEAYYQQAVAVLHEAGLSVPEFETSVSPLPCGCPGTLSKLLKNATSGPANKESSSMVAPVESQLRQWPIQLKLLNVNAGFFDQAELLIAADCTAFALAGFHAELLKGKILVIFCPKLDGANEEYIEKLQEIFSRHEIKSVTVARMAVPCCGGTVSIVSEALKRAGIQLPIEVKIIDMDGSIK